MTDPIRRLNLLHVVNAYRLGGMENVVAEMAGRLFEMGFTVSICALTVADGFRSRLPGNVELFELRKDPGLDPICVLSLRRLLRSREFDVVHSHNWSGLVYSVAAMVGSSTPLVHGEHAQLYSWERVRWRLLVRRALYSRCDRIHTVSRSQAKELHELGVSALKPAEVICNGVASDRFRPTSKVDARLRLGLPIEGRLLGMVARFVPEKRHRLVLEAFDRLGEMFPDVGLVLVGGGGVGEDGIRKLVELHRFRKRIFWLGKQDEMVDVYNALDLVVLPSTAEGMSNVCLEAMSCGVPVLRHQESGVDDLIQDGSNGFLRDLNSGEALVCAIAELLGSTALLKATGAAARKLIVQDYKPHETAKKYAALYRHVVEGK